MSGPQTWKTYLDMLAKADDLKALLWEKGDPLVEAELHRQLLMDASLGYFLYFQSDADHPDFCPLLNSVYLLQPNPDDTYYFAPIAEDGVYRVTGERGSVHLLTFTVTGSMFGTSDVPEKQVAEYDADTLTIGPDGRFEVIFSAERPAGHTGDWRKTGTGSRGLLLRQRSYDWGRERDARVAIERLDTKHLKPRMSAEAIDSNARGLVGFTERLSRLWLQHQNRMRDRLGDNKIEFTGFTDYGGVKAQVYWQGVFRFAPGEALILETEVPEKQRYWNIQLNDQLWNTLEYVYRQSSLNGHQARVDSDGRFRAVLATEDPGVPNWLDTCENYLGTLVGRWYECSSQPLPTLKRVPLAQLRNHLPADTPVVTAEERRRILSARREGGQLRRRW